MRSLRARLLAGLLGLLTVIGVLAGLAAYLLDRNEVDESLDGQLRQLAMNVGTTAFPVAGSEVNGVPIDPEDRFVITIWDTSGRVRSSDPTFSPLRPTATGYSDFDAAGEAWRAYTQFDGDQTVQVAQRMVVRAEFAASSAVRAVLPVAALIPLSWLLVGWVVARVLRPLRDVTSELRQWGSARTNPLSLKGIPDEILPLAVATNDLVTRLQSQLEFRERFISDAAHELRTPLTALRLQVRNLAESTASPNQAGLIAEMSAGVRRMSDMVGKLLQLARSDGSAPTPELIPIDLSEAVAASLQDVVRIAAEKEIDIGVVTSSPERVLADPDELRTLLGNLVENAVRYTPQGGVVDISVEHRTGTVVLEVRDTGPGIPEPLLDRVFGRFVRLHGDQVDGSGLGLTIVRAIADRCGAEVTLANRSDRTGLVARVTFASAGPPAELVRLGPSPAMKRVGSPS
jgi:two-component system, OmpR family, sensor kinase